MSDARVAIPRLASVAATVALLVTGFLRLNEGQANHRPVGSLTNLLTWSVIIGIIALIIQWKLGPTNRRGKAALRNAGQARRTGQVPAPASGLQPGGFQSDGFQPESFGPGGFGPEMTRPMHGVFPANDAGTGAALFAPVLLGVALGGLTQVPDADLRSALMAGLPSPSSGGSSSSCGSSPSSCGGALWRRREQLRRMTSPASRPSRATGPGPAGASGVGIGWRLEIDLTVPRLPGLDFVEIVAENVHPDHVPAALMALHVSGTPVIPHGVSLSLGGADPLDPAKLARLSALASAFGSPLVSEHVVFCRRRGSRPGTCCRCPERGQRWTSW